MDITPQIAVHASFGVAAILTGVAALSATKGARVHRTTGTIFFAVMLATAASGAYLGFIGGDAGNAIGGLVTLYVVLTSWVTVRRKERQTGWFEISAFLFAATGAVLGYITTVAAMAKGTALLGGIPGMTLASVAALAAALDLSVILRGGLAGKQRIARHLWRMTLGFAAAVGSFFPGQLQIFPDYIREIRPIIILFIPFFMLIGLMFAWLIVVLFTKWYDRGGEPRIKEGAAS